MNNDLIFFIIFGVIFFSIGYVLNRKTSKSFASKEYLVEGETELNVLKSVFATQRFLLSWVIYPSADIFVTDKRIVIYTNVKRGYHTLPTSIFYKESDRNKMGGLVTSYILSSIQIEDQKTIIKGSRLFMGFTWKVNHTELAKMAEEAKKIS